MRKQVGPKICIVFLLALVRKKYNNETKLRNVFLGRPVLLLVLVLEEAPHKVPDGGLRLGVVLVLLAGKDVLDGDDHLGVAPLPYLHLAYRSAAFEIDCLREGPFPSRPGRILKFVLVRLHKLRVRIRFGQE